jgi:2-methylisocitrate lyase-like PEP mutase family enzyme
MLHAGEPFVMPNPWDPGSARMLEALGFQVLATTSSGFAFMLGRCDGEATLDEVVEHTAALDRATMLPLSVDLENGYGAATRDVAQAVTRVADAGAVGCSIEDCDPAEGIYDLDHSTERVAARERVGAARSVTATAHRRRRAADQRRRRAHVGRGSAVGGDRHPRPRRLLAARRRPPARRMAETCTAL